MKNKRLILLLCIASAFLSGFAIVPKTETSHRWMRITDVERTDSALRIGIRLQHLPHYWVKLDPHKRLVATSDTTLQYKLIATENIELNKKIWMPESGYHEGVLVFEKVPDNVKVVDLAGDDLSDVGSCIYGIHLDEPYTQLTPHMISLSEILQGSELPSETWTGLDPKRYSDLSFYDDEGMVNLRGRITDYSPKFGVSTFSVTTKNDFIDEEKVNVGYISEDGTFEMDIPLAYPQFDYFKLGDIHKELFLIPGDTLSIVTCMAQKIDPKSGYCPEYFGYEGETNDAVVVNLLTDSIYRKHGLNSLYKRFKVEDTDSMKQDVYRQSEKLVALLDTVNADITGILAHAPISVFAKDMVSTAALGQIYTQMEETQMDFRFKKGPTYEKGEDGILTFKEGESLDEITLLRPWMKYKEQIYNNPIMICQGRIIPNRWKFNSLFRPSGMAAEGMESVEGTNAYISTDDLNLPYTSDLNHLDSIGLGNCFAAQLVRTASLIDNFHTTDTPSSKRLKRNNKLVANLIKHTDYDRLNEIVMSEFNDFVKDVLIAENQIGDAVDSSIVIPNSPEGDILAKIIEPYKGNVLFLDFWGIGCGPCRSGMMKQKPLLEKLADKPFKALYIANADDGIDACKKWLRKEEIKGEHIFVSGDDWERLRGLFNFSGIPFGVLINKEGKIEKTHYHIAEEEPLLTKALQQ